MKSKKHIVIIFCAFAIIASLGFTSIFFFDLRVNKLNDNIEGLEKRRKTILWNMEQSEKHHDIARNMRTQIDILSALNVNASLRNEELLDLLATSAASVVALAKEYNGEAKNHEELYADLLKRITSYEDFEKIHKPNMMLAAKYANDVNSKIKTRKKEIENIIWWKSGVLIIAIIFNIIALIFNGIITYFGSKRTEEKLAK
jgi:type II secretory pathway component PulF